MGWLVGFSKYEKEGNGLKRDSSLWDAMVLLVGSGVGE